MILFCLVYQVISLGLDEIGTVWPSGTLPISNSFTNADKISDYTFTFFTEHSLPRFSNLNVVFPSQYPENLGVSSCLSSLGTCIIDNTTVQVTLSDPLYRFKKTNLIVYGIQNPSSQGGTGNFRILTYENSNLIDCNNRFGLVGIAQKVGKLLSGSANVVENDSLLAGASTRYEFKFRLYRDFAAWNWIRITFPDDGFILDTYPTCSAFQINGYIISGNLNCLTEGNKVTVFGINEDIPGSAFIGIRLNAINPLFSVQTGTFGIETGKNSTLTVYDEIFGISGLTIRPGLITRVALGVTNSSLILAQGKLNMYRLQFLVSNTVQQGGSIEVLCTSNFQFASYFYIEFGLSDISASEPVNTYYDSSTNTIKISSFKTLNPEVISLLVTMTNPSSTGVTDPLIIRTIDPDNNLIDENTDEAFVYISSITSPTASSVTFPSGSSATGSSIDLQIQISPQFEVPAGGWVIFLLPYGFEADSYTQDCYAKPTYESEAASPDCYYKDGKIHLQLFKDSAGIYGKFEAGLSSHIRITTLLSPIRASTYFFDYCTYTSENKIIESGTASGVLTASSLSVSINVIHKGISTPTVIEVSFTINKQLCSSKSGSLTTDLQCFIELEFPTSTGSSDLFPLDLGLPTSSVPCKGIQGISQSSLICSITSSPTSASTPVYVTISNFTQIDANTLIKIHFASILYVKTTNSGSITVTTFEYNNRIRYNLESGSNSFPAGLAIPTKTSLAVTLTLSEKTVQSSTTLSTGTSFTSSTASGSTTPYILIHIYQSHDQGYCIGASLTCTFDSIVYDCECYEGADIILVTLTGNFATGSHTMQISGLINPESVPSTNDDLLVYIIGGNTIKQILGFSGQIPLLKPGEFIKSQIAPSDLRQGTVFVSYSVIISPQHPIPEGGYIEITFPSEYDLSSSSPVPTCYSDYLHASSDAVSCELNSNTVTLTEFSRFKEEFIVVVWVQGVKNPEVESTSEFVIRTLNSDQRVIDENTESGSIEFVGSFEAENISFLDIYIFPDNANATAEYIFTFTPSSFLGVGSVIKIDFPIKQFGSLPSSPKCRFSGPIITFAECTTSASDLFIITDKDLPFKPLSISVLGLRNFDQGTSDAFAISAKYDGTVVQQTTSTTSKLTITTGSQAATLSVSNIIFSPQNEAEKATYEFYLSPKTGISSSQNLIIKFPEQYDPRLGDDLNCWAEGLTGYLECSVFHAYTIIVTKNDPLSACTSCSIVLYISGIYNPPKGWVGEFTIGILESNSFTELNEYAGKVEIQSSPQYLEILYTVPSSLYSRTIQTMEFNITCNETIPTSDSAGEIWIDYPNDYTLDGSFLTCQSSQYWASGSPKCSVLYNKVIFTGQTETYSGNLKLLVQSLPNPLNNVLADYITVEVADNFHRNILARSYPNLDPNRFQYTYPGPLIIVNENQSFVVRRGSYSKFIKIEFDYPAALNLTLIPKSGDFLFYPEKILVFIGDLETEFRVSVPFDTEDTEYIISWTILGETDPAYYTPILKSKFEVTKDDLISIEVEEIMPIPKSFTSLPIVIELEQAPDKDLTVHLALSDEITGVELSSDQILFESGVYKLNFTISVNELVSQSSSQVLLSISGTNAEAYSLKTSSISFKIIENSPTPTILSAGVIRSTRTSATFTISSNIFCWLYYAYALKGTLPTSFQETKAQGPPTYTTTNTKYGVLRVSKSTTQVFTIFQLSASTRYSLFLWAEDLTGAQSSTCQKLDFDTDEIYPTGQVKLKFKQVYLNDVEIQRTSDVIQLYLSLHNWRILKNIDDTLQMDPNKVYSESADWPEVTFYILDKIDTEVYPSPLVMIKRLAGYQDEIQGKLNNFDERFKIRGSNVEVDACEFMEYAHVVNDTSDYKNISVKASLKQEGFIYAIAVLETADPGLPFAFQVFQGNDGWNRPALMMHTNVSAGVSQSLLFTQLNDNTTYNLYIICTNNNPGYAELLPDSKVISLSWKTDPKPPRSKFSIEMSNPLLQSFLILYLSFIF